MSRSSVLARRVTWASARAFPPRSTGIILSFIRHQPNRGIQVSSRFRMKTGSRKIVTRTKVSQKDWCLAATIMPPVAGMFSRPVTS